MRKSRPFYDDLWCIITGQLYVSPLRWFDHSLKIEGGAVWFVKIEVQQPCRWTWNENLIRLDHLYAKSTDDLGTTSNLEVGAFHVYDIIQMD